MRLRYLILLFLITAASAQQVGGTVKITSSTGGAITATAGSLNVNITGGGGGGGTVNQGTPNTLANAWPMELTIDGVNIAGTATHPFRIDPTGTTTQPDNLTQVASTTLGVPQTFGTPPSGIVLGTSADLYISGTRARSNQTTTASGVQDVNIVGSLGVTNSATNGTFARLTDNTTAVGVIVGTTALKTDMSSIAGTATNTAAAGTQKVGIVGGTNVTLDAASAATAPVNAIAVGAKYLTAAPAPTTGQQVPIQANSNGDTIVTVNRRSELVGKSTTIASSGAATTVVAAGAAGVFADISSLIITPTAQANGTAFTASLSDGTNTYIYDLNTGSTTALVIQPPLVISWNPPLPATTAATAWTITLSSATVTVHITTTAILQKAD